MKRTVLFCVILASLFSCTYVISERNREGAEISVPFSEVQGQSDKFRGKTFIFGGIIAETVITGNGAEIEVVQMPLDRWGYIISRDRSEGRFIVRSSRHLDPIIYRKGREITVAGTLADIRTGKLGQMEYAYPVFDALEIRLTRPDTHEPYYWQGPYWYPAYPYPYRYPFWHDPFGYYPPRFY